MSYITFQHIVMKGVYHLTPFALVIFLSCMARCYLFFTHFCSPREGYATHYTSRWIYPQNLVAQHITFQSRRPLFGFSCTRMDGID